MILKKVLGGSFVLACAVSSVAHAADFHASTVRSLGMGGSNVASTNGVDGSFWNPAAYGFFSADDTSAATKSVDNSAMSEKTWGADLGAGAGLSVFGPLEENVNKLEALAALPAGLNQTFTPANTASNITTAANFVNGLASLNPAPMGANLFADANFGARVTNYGVSVRGYADVNGSISIDNANIGLNVFSSLTGGTVPAGTPATVAGLPGGYFTPVERQSMFDTLTASAGLTSQQAVATIGAYEAALVTNPPTTGETSQDMVNNLNVLATSPGDINNNNTKYVVKGATIQEFGITYGHAISERLSVGGVAKYLKADVYYIPSNIVGTTVDTTAFDTNNAVSSTAFGLDLGVMYRIPAWQFGLTIRNINEPSFRHSSAYTYTLKRQAKVGAAWIPSDEFTVEAGLDLTENEGADADTKTRYWNVGLEWDAWSVVAIRMGAFNNMAQSDVGLVPTVGLGLNLWAIRVDLAAAQSTKDITLNGDTVPAYAAASLAISSDF